MLNARKFGIIAILSIAVIICSGSRADGSNRLKKPADKIVAFHIDMNIKQFRADYLRKWLKKLAGFGYNTIIWEIENNVQWETCPECVSPDAFTKPEFRELLDYSRGLGLEPIPLLQTLGHCEYVLKHDEYKDMAEVAGRIDQYCPLNPKVVPFLTRWIDEYLDLFGNVKRMHLGDDEAMSLGECDLCRAYVETHSKSDLYINYVNRVSRPLIERGVQPVIWADMVLHYPESIDKLSRKIMFMDWMYSVYRGNGKVYVWGKGFRTADRLDPETLKIFGDVLFPHGRTAGQPPETFYTADYLAGKGFDVAVCSSSASHGDTVFAGRQTVHMRNTFDFFHKGLMDSIAGAVQTSWTVRLVPWELQTASIELPSYIISHPDGTLDDYKRYYVQQHFGTDTVPFFEATEMFAKPCPFSEARSLGFYKDAQPVPLDHVQKEIDKMADNNQLESQFGACMKRLAEYRKGLDMLGVCDRNARKGHDELDAWRLAARNLINRAEASAYLISAKMNKKLQPDSIGSAQEILDAMRELRTETSAVMATKIKPTRKREIMAWLYDSMEAAMAGS